MVIDTRSAPDFPHDSQKELYNVRREFALTVKFPYDPEYEQTYIGTMTAERASEVLAKTTGELKAYKQRISRIMKKSKGKVTTTTATETVVDASGEAPTNTGDDGVLGDTSANETASNENSAHERETDIESVHETEPSDSSSSSGSDDDDDPRRRTSKTDKRTIRGRTP
jgi:hypothetical protein